MYLACLVRQVILPPNCSFSLVKLKQKLCFVVPCQSSTTAKLCESCPKGQVMQKHTYSVQKVIQQCADFSLILSSFQSLILPRCSLSNTDRDDPLGCVRPAEGRGVSCCGLWMNSFPLTVLPFSSDSLKINNFNCILQDVFNLSLDFGYSCILSLKWKIRCMPEGNHICSLLLLVIFIHLYNFDVPVDNFSSSSLFYYLLCLLFSIIFIYPLLFHS